jgi:hypothetical protein
MYNDQRGILAVRRRRIMPIRLESKRFDHARSLHPTLSSLYTSLLQSPVTFDAVQPLLKWHLRSANPDDVSWPIYEFLRIHWRNVLLASKTKGRRKGKHSSSHAYAFETRSRRNISEVLLLHREGIRCHYTAIHFKPVILRISCRAKNDRFFFPKMSNGAKLAMPY